MELDIHNHFSFMKKNSCCEEFFLQNNSHPKITIFHHNRHRSWSWGQGLSDCPRCLEGWIFYSQFFGRGLMIHVTFKHGPGVFAESWRVARVFFWSPLSGSFPMVKLYCWRFCFEGSLRWKQKISDLCGAKAVLKRLDIWRRSAAWASGFAHLRSAKRGVFFKQSNKVKIATVERLLWRQRKKTHAKHYITPGSLGADSQTQGFWGKPAQKAFPMASLEDDSKTLAPHRHAAEGSLDMIFETTVMWYVVLLHSSLADFHLTTCSLHFPPLSLEKSPTWNPAVATGPCRHHGDPPGSDQSGRDQFNSFRFVWHMWHLSASLGCHRFEALLLMLGVSELGRFIQTIANVCSFTPKKIDCLAMHHKDGSKKVVEKFECISRPDQLKASSSLSSLVYELSAGCWRYLSCSLPAAQTKESKDIKLWDIGFMDVKSHPFLLIFLYPKPIPSGITQQGTTLESLCVCDGTTVWWRPAMPQVVSKLSGRNDNGKQLWRS